MSHNVQKIAKMSDFRIVIKRCVLAKGVVCRTTYQYHQSNYWPIVSNEYFDGQGTWLDYKINIILGLFSKSTLCVEHCTRPSFGNNLI